MKKLRYLILLILIQTFLSSSVYADTNNIIIFNDITANFKWAENDIYYFVNEGVIQGRGDNKFAPSEKVTREEFAKMITLGFKADLICPDEATFSDVNKSNWSYEHIETCKQFMTGYVNPFGGKPSFRPQEAATREDMAVALVKIMGYKEDDVYDTSYLDYYYSDSKKISPSLKKYMAIAVEKGLMEGYNGKLRPTDNINRAEAVALLSRATKQSVSDMTDEINFECTYEKSKSEVGVYTINISANEELDITIDGEEIPLDYDYWSGKYSTSVAYKFEVECEHTFVIEATKGVKKAVKKLVIKHETLAPTIDFTYCPETSDKESITIKGTVKDEIDSEPILYVNGETVYVDYYGNWSTTINLNEGNNKIEFKAINKFKKETQICKYIDFGVGKPILSVSYCPTSTEDETITIKGKVEDINDNNPKVYVNDKEMYVGYYGDWSTTVDLHEGDNVITIKAINKNGKETIIKKNVMFNLGAPNLTVTNCPTDSQYETATIKGKVDDKNDNNPKVYVNNSEIYVGYYGDWSTTVNLKEGDNLIKIRAVNKDGKETSIEKHITFSLGGPELTITSCPSESTYETVTIKGSIDDDNDNNPKVYVNNKEIYVGYYGEWSTTLALEEGINDVTIKAVNKDGKETIEKRTINYSIPAPKIKVTYCPESTNENKVTIKGSVSDTNDNNPKVYINGKEVYLNYYNEFSYDLTLDIGDNNVVIKAINKDGKETIETYNIVYEMSKPKLVITNYPEITNENKAKIYGYVDYNGKDYTVTINSNSVVCDNDKVFNIDVDLIEGDNVFTIKVVNKYGYENVITLTIKYQP